MKEILVIGAGKGIGLASVQSLQNEFNISAVSRSLTPELQATQARVWLADVSTDELGFVSELPEILHGLVFCPGSIVLKPFQRLTTADFEQDFRQNVLGFVRVLQAVLPKLKAAQGASVVGFSTVAAKVGMNFHASVSTSKAALEGLFRALAAEYANNQIRFNLIAPSLTHTPLAASLLSTAEKQEAAAKRHPLQRVGTPQDMAHLVRYLIGNESSWMTGQVLSLDGGMSVLK